MFNEYNISLDNDEDNYPSLAHMIICAQNEMEIIEEGKRKGMEKGIEEGKELLSKFYSKLIDDDRYDDMIRSLKDREYLEQLYREYGMCYPF